MLNKKYNAYLNATKRILARIRPTNLVYRFMQINDVEFVLSSLSSEAKNGHFTAAFLDDFEYEQFKKSLVLRANNKICPKLIHGKVTALTNFYFIFENGKGEKVGFIELSEKQSGDFCRSTLVFENVEIMSVVIAKEHRGKGYTKRLISAALSELPTKKTVFARCLEPSVKMVRILEQLGFSCVKITPRGSKWMELKVRSDLIQDT